MSSPRLRAMASVRDPHPTLPTGNAAVRPSVREYPEPVTSGGLLNQARAREHLPSLSSGNPPVRPSAWGRLDPSNRWAFDPGESQRSSPGLLSGSLFAQARARSHTLRLPSRGLLAQARPSTRAYACESIGRIRDLYESAQEPFRGFSGAGTYYYRQSLTTRRPEHRSAGIHNHGIS